MVSQLKSGEKMFVFFPGIVPVLLGLLSNTTTRLGTRCGRANRLSSKSRQEPEMARSQRTSPSVMSQVLTGELWM
jgi:hypothetical protein